MPELNIVSQKEQQEYWNQRALQFGHTGWSNLYLYRHDQVSRIKSIIDILDIEDDAKVLDFGCGTGEFVEAVAKRFPGCVITGLDVSDRVIVLAHERLHSFDNVELICGDIDSIPFGSGNYDLILCVTVLQHIDPSRLHAVLAHCASLLRSTGKMIVIENIYRSGRTNNYINTALDESVWSDILTASGFRIDKLTSYPHWGAIFVESIIPILGRFRERMRSNNSITAAASIVPKPGAHGREKANLLIRFLLILASPFDHLLRVLPPKSLRHYTLFSLIKK